MEHVTPARTYLLTALALLVLTAATYFAARVDLGPFNNLIALGIATLKAALIVLIFMHARRSDALTKIMILFAIFWMAVLILGTLDDYVTRSWLPLPGL